MTVAVEKLSCAKAAPPSVHQAILRAASRLHALFTESQLVVACWKADTERFGLRGFECLYPDNNRVRAALCGKRGMFSKGLLGRVGDRIMVMPGSAGDGKGGR